MSVNIHIYNHRNFPCPVGWTVEETESRIRSMYGLVNGGIIKNGIVMRSTDSITADGEYQFVNFHENQGMFFIFIL